jgi:hypothetical protein
MLRALLAFVKRTRRLFGMIAKIGELAFDSRKQALGVLALTHLGVERAGTALEIADLRKPLLLARVHDRVRRHRMGMRGADGVDRLP